jgi:hypothetical protein
MSKFTNPLDGVRVAAPCPANWERMVGDARMRYCGQCNLHVYNLSGMTRTEAEALIANTEGRLCVRFYRRADGTVLTRNCPVGLRALKRRVSRTAGAMLSAALGFLAGVGLDLGFAIRATTTTHTMGTVAMPAPRSDGTAVPVVASDESNPPVKQVQGMIARPAVVGKMVRREYAVGDATVEGVRRQSKRNR